jgi:hypothetical protein
MKETIAEYHHSFSKASVENYLKTSLLQDTAGVAMWHCECAII